MKTSVSSFSAGPIRQLRAALISPVNPKMSGTRVLNFVAFPSPEYKLPVFGADLVTLPGGHLVALDLHPMLPAKEHEALVLPRLGPVHRLHQNPLGGPGLPWGGDLPLEARPFFSPCALWTRLAGDEEGTTRLQHEVCEGAVLDYLDVFLDLAAGAHGPAPASAVEAQRSYCRYRIDKDPARGMLTRMHGEEWTEKLIREVLFAC